MTSRTRARLFTVIGVLALVVGLLWIGQGANLIGGSSMTGQPMWLIIGLVVAAGGAVLLILAARAGRDPNGPPGQH
ncbi:hypothetical protein [Microlunatus parietis]|uniref:Type VI protein secretion system component VasK n=1 Tax=Microlunatus parietis TaxID=682979 RepID=A0A7Y9L6W4_9ACTN|nr:hypothetical protein [Microlunatus parietis]NYE69224.1 type VI protein secretion system component VasK [Microlunatus parietis]